MMKMFKRNLMRIKRRFLEYDYDVMILYMLWREFGVTVFIFALLLLFFVAKKAIGLN